MTVRPLADHDDLIDLGEFATWLKASSEIAVQTIEAEDISYVRIGARGQYRISTRSIAEVFDVDLHEGDDDGVVEEAAIAKHRPTTPAAVAAVPPLHEEVQHAQG